MEIPVICGKRAERLSEVVAVRAVARRHLDEIMKVDQPPEGG